MEMDRREMMGALAAFAAFGSVMAEAQDLSGMAKSRVFSYAALPVAHYANGGEGRAVIKGTLPTGEYVEVHETVLPAGKMPHPPHRHANTEFVMIRTGKLEFINDGKVEPVGPGDVIYTASNVMHGLRNVGDTPSLYFVVSVGVQTAAVE